MLTPSSRLGDDLYLLYLSVLAWFLLPFYGALLSELMPSSWPHYNNAFDGAVLAAGLLGAWSGIRGGPLMVSRAAIVHELGAPVSKRRLLLPWLLRQATAWSICAAVLATVALVLADKDSFGYATAFAASAGALLATLSANFIAIICMIATHGDERRRMPLLATAALIYLTPAIAKTAGATFTEGPGLAVLASSTAIGAVIAIFALAFAPIEPLWNRATAIEAMRSSLQQVDFQRVLLDLRNVGERPAYATRTTLARPWLPLPLWRHVAAVQHTIGWHLIRLSVFSGLIGVIFWRSDVSQGIIALAAAGAAMMLGIELAGSVASLADQMTFIVHYPRRSSRVLAGQIITSVFIGVGLVAVVVLAGISSSPRSVAGVLLICAAGALGATMQARLGSPDVAAMLDKVGVANLSALLWGRALAGPLVVLVTSAAVFHQFFRPEPLSPWLYGLIAAALGIAFWVSRDPLERTDQRPRRGEL